MYRHQATLARAVVGISTALVGWGFVVGIIPHPLLSFDFAVVIPFLHNHNSLCLYFDNSQRWRT